MSEQLPIIQIATLITNGLILLFIVFYFVRLKKKEKEFEQKNAQADTDYHKIVNDALNKERKILEDATKEATQVIAGAQYISQSSKEAIDQTLQKMVADIHQGVSNSAHQFLLNYQGSLQQLSNQSLTDFQSVTKELEADMKNQLISFRESMLPRLEKELESYRQNRMNEANALINRIIQKISQDVLRKSISAEDHQKLIIESLEKAKKEGIFN